MARSNLDIARELAKAYDSGDFATFASFLHPDTELVTVEGWLDGGVFHGRDAVLGFYLRYEEAWVSEADVEWTGWEELGDAVVARNVRRLRGRHTGLSATLDQWITLTFSDGLVASTRWFWTRDAAVAAALER